MIPYLDEGHPDGFPIVIDFSALAVEAPENPGFPYRDQTWMTTVFQRAWGFVAPTKYARMMTHYPDYKREGKYILPGGMIRVSVVPSFHWTGAEEGGYTPQPLDRWMHWYQTVETFVSLANADVGTAIVHELGHVFFSSVGGNPMHTDKAGTVFLAPPPANATIDGPMVANMWGGAFANYYAGVRYDDQGQMVTLPIPVRP